jgi:adenylylsulfate kinase-like enzyme
MIILLFGQPASGKTTLADEFIDNANYTRSASKFVRIDGDKWREITKNKDYSKEGRVRNLKGAFDMALYLEQEGYTPVLSFVTPYKELRDYLKEHSKKLVQIYLQYSGDRGRNMNFAKDFEEPSDEQNMLSLDTSALNIDECISKIIDYAQQ